MVANIDGEELRLRRLLKGLSQIVVAKEVGIHPVTLNRYERGVYKPPPERTEAILAAIIRLAQAKGGDRVQS